MFSLPTTDTRPDSFTQQMRMEEINPTTPPNEDGGGSLTYEINAAGPNSWFVPSSSYFLAKVEVKEANGNVAASASETFVSYPLSTIVQSMTHSIQGALIESMTEVPLISQVDIRTHYPRDYHDTLSHTLRLDTDDDASALSPWDGSTSEFECAWLPPGALWKYKGGLPGMRQRITINLFSGLVQRMLKKTDGGDITTGTSDAGQFTIKLKSLVLYAAYLVPKSPIPPPPSVVLSLPFLSMGLVNLTGSGNYAFSVAPSTDKFYIVMREDDAPDGSTAHALDKFTSTASSLEVQYAGIRSPFVADTNLVGGKSTRAFLDYQAAAGLAFRGLGMPNDQKTWADNCIFGYVFEKPVNDASTNVTVRVGGSPGSDKQLGLLYVHHRLIRIAYDDSGLASSCTVVENLA